MDNEKFEESFVIISPDEEEDEYSSHESSPGPSTPQHLTNSPASEKKLKPKLFKYKKLFSFKRKPIEKRLRTNDEIEQQLGQFKIDRKFENLILLYSCEFVRLYVIHPNAIVDAIYENAGLQVIRLNETKTYLLSFCLKVIDRLRHCEWIYPLDKDNFHCLYTGYGAFILPELPIQRSQHYDRDGITYGLVVPKASTEIVLDILEGVLSVSMREILASTTNRESENVAKKFRYISSGYIKGVERACELLGHSADALKIKLEPPPRSPSPIICEKLKSHIEATKNVTGVAANLTEKCSIVAGSASVALGRYLTPQIQNLSPLLTKSLGINPDPAEKSSAHHGPLGIATGTLEDASTNLVSSMERSTSMLKRNVSTKNVAQLIDHKYGDGCGSSVESTFYSVGNVMNLSKNLKSTSPKSLLRRTARSTSIAIAREYKDSDFDRK